MERPIRAALISVLAALAMVAAACGGDGGGPLAVGDDAPDFELPDASGGTVSLADFGGEPVLLYFHMAEG
jgi:cytochrome oxidase Cu insertion factor (SCO1/SenC/PrrC family)